MMTTTTTDSHPHFDPSTMLAGRVALVTGSTSGIGLGIAAALAEQGASVIVNGCGDPEPALARIGRTGARVGYHAADLTRASEIEALMTYAARGYGGVDILVNNAGIQHVAPLDEFPPERWDAVLALILTAAFHTTRLALPHMRARGWGRIINIASVHGLVASTGKAAYVAAKHGLLGLTKVTALETARESITCNALCPGWVDTQMAQDAVARIAAKTGRSEDQARTQLAAMSPQHRMISPDEVAHAAVMLCGDGARGIHGQTIVIDGGAVLK